VSRLWQEYRATLKSPEVEETVDLLLHRPLAFVIAKLSFRTPITPNQITLGSMLLGMAGGAALFGAPPWAGIVGGTLLFVSQVLDCADGMLARMRRSSSALGRMLDGMADGMTLTAACLGTTWGIVRLHPSPLWLPIALVGAVALTIYLGVLQTLAYDHYKNVFLRMTRDSAADEDLEEAQARAEAGRNEPRSLVERLTWTMYLGYLGRQRRMLGWYDPFTVGRLRQLPAYDAERAERYRRHALGPLRWFRGFFGVGSLVFGFSLFNAIGQPDWFLVYRLGLLNVIFFLVAMPLQRRASRRAFRELGLAELTIGAVARQDDAVATSSAPDEKEPAAAKSGARAARSPLA
jgi:phosphatidylglycerophosphate synthase